MWVRLTRRLAGCIDGVNLSAHQIGDVFEVTRHETELLIAEAWAVEVACRAQPLPGDRAVGFRAVNGSDSRQMIAALREVGTQIHLQLFLPRDHRRAEDRIREDWHDEHATVLNAMPLCRSPHCGD